MKSNHRKDSDSFRIMICLNKIYTHKIDRGEMSRMNWNLFWTAFGAIGGTLGAIATTSAVIVALWQTKYNQKKKLKLSFSDNISIVPQSGSIIKRYVGVTVANIGNREVVIKGWGFELKKPYSMMIVSDISSFDKWIQPKLPYRLSLEESITLYYEKDLFTKVVTDYCDKEELKQYKPIRFYVVDSTDKRHYIKTQKNAINYYKQQESH